MTDWNDPKSKISKYFSVHDATFLPSWQIHHTPSAEERVNILATAVKMDCVREFLGAPISVHVWIRPAAVNCPGDSRSGQDYNAFVKGAQKSTHLVGKAVDWSVVGKRSAAECAEIRTKLLSKLEEFGIRMEDINGNWIHVDTGAVINKRFFKP